MKLVKSLLLGSAAALAAAAGAQAADLPMRKAAPVEYVRVCTAYGAGFFYIPGTDTCLRVGGRARFEYNYQSLRSRNSSNSGYRGLGRLNIDARTQTPYGTLRAFVRFEIASRSGGYLKSGTAERFANSFFGTGQDTQTQLQKYVEVDKAYIQFAGFTAGRAASFFDFYAHDVELIGSSLGSDVSATNLLAYTATFGSGFSASVAMEDPTYRRNTVFANANTGTTGFVSGTVPGAQNGVNFTTGAVPFAFIGNAFNAAGVPTSAFALDVIQRNNMPDFVGALRYDQAWGSAQISGAVHEIRVGTYSTAVGAFAVNGGAALAAPQPRIPNAEYGFGVQGGLKINAPQIAPGDVLWLQAGYAQGAGSYSGVFVPPGSDTLTGGAYTNRFTTGLTQADLVYDARGRAHLTETYSGTIAFLHYWTPEIRQGVFASYAQILYDTSLRSFAGPAGATATVRNQFDPNLKSYSDIYVGSNLIWSPVRDLDIGVEVVYERLDPRGRVADANKGGTVGPGGTVGGTGRTITTDDNIVTRFRIQRDF